ncbi:MAG: acyltransferase family protein [Lachnospiraceae bacterium]|nr:acyltransferase family protein [Lachnospiraceae bacterium]
MNRSKTFDIMKAIAIFFVVLGHVCASYNIQDGIIAITYFTRMPLFFFVSGYFLEKSISKYSTKSLLKKKFVSLVLPYFIWSAVAFLVNVGMALISDVGCNKEWIISEFVEVFIHARSVWYLIVLFLTDVIYILLKKNRVPLLMIGIVWILLAFLIPGKIFNLYKFKWLFPFFVLGGLFCGNEHMNLIETIKKYTKDRLVLQAIVGLVLFFILDIVLYKEPYFTEYTEFRYSSGQSVLWGLVFYAISIWGIAVWMQIAYVIQNRITKIGSFVSDLLVMCGEFSLDIYLIHMMFMKIIPLDLRELSVGNGLTVLALVYAFIIIMLIAIISKYVLCKIPIYRMVTGRIRL